MRHIEKLKQIVSNAYALYAYALWLNEISIFWVIQIHFSLYQVSLLEKLFLHFITSRKIVLWQYPCQELWKYSPMNRECYFTTSMRNAESETDSHLVLKNLHLFRTLKQAMQINKEICYTVFSMHCVYKHKSYYTH